MTIQDAQITLSTSDDPPALIKVSRNALIGHSRVFADMLSLNLESDRIDGAIPVDESKEDLEILVQLFEGKDMEGICDGLSQIQWEMIGKLSDKYDCAFIRKMVESKAWQIEAEKGSATFAFTLATLTGNGSLIKCTAKRAVLIEDLNSADLRVSREWKDKLAVWRTLHSAKCFEVLCAMTKYPPKCRSQYPCVKNCLANGKTIWSDFVISATQHFNTCVVSTLPLDGVMSSNGVCDNYKTSIVACAARLQASWGEWDDVPVNGDAVGAFRDILRYR